jgi:hypothetical protein
MLSIIIKKTKNLLSWGKKCIIIDLLLEARLLSLYLFVNLNVGSI